MVIKNNLTGEEVANQGYIGGIIRTKTNQVESLNFKKTGNERSEMFWKISSEINDPSQKNE